MADLGNKHECLGCGTKFYDLGKSKLICPKCEGDQAELAKESAGGSAVKGKKPTAKKKATKAKAKKTKKAAAKKAPKDTAAADEKS